MQNKFKKKTILNAAAITGHRESNKEQQLMFDRTRVLTRKSYRLLFAKISTCSSAIKEKSQNIALPFLYMKHKLILLF